MKRSLLAVFFLILTLPAVAKPQWMEATFKGIEMGDYAHLLVETVEGEEQSFFIANDPSFQPYLDAPEEHEGEQVRILWQRVEKVIPEAGGKMEIEEALSIMPAAD